MKFYGNNGYPEFHDTANFLTICKMRNIYKVKTPSVGKVNRDSTCEPIKQTTAEQLFYLVNIVSWVKDWKNINSITDERNHNNCCLSSLLCIKPLVTDPLYLACMAKI